MDGRIGSYHPQYDGSHLWIFRRTGIGLVSHDIWIDISNGTVEPVAIMGAYLEPRVYAVMKSDWLFTPVTTLFISICLIVACLSSIQLNPIKAIRSE